MPMSVSEKKKVVDGLIANSCGCWKKGDEALLNGFKDEKLNELATANATHRQQVTIVNALTKGIDVGGRVVRYEPAAKQIKVTTVNVDPDDDTTDGAGADDELGGVGDADDVDDVTTTSNGRNVTEAEYLRSMPASIRKTFQNARRVENTEKAKIVRRLVANADESRRGAIVKRYMKKDLNELQELADLMLTDNDETNGSMFFGFPVDANFFGQQGSAHSQNAHDSEEDDLLDLPSETMSLA